MKIRLRKIVGAVMVVIGLCLVVIFASGSVIRATAHGRTYSDTSTIPHRQVGLVLGCSRQLPDGRLNLFFSRRIAAARQLFESHKVDYLIVSGDNHVAGYDEPSDMKRTLVDAGVPPDRIYCDYAGFRTLDSVARAKTIFGQTNITLVSQEFHNQRAIFIARHEGIDAVGFNAPDIDAYNSFGTRLREQFARVRTVLDVYLLGTRPKFGGPNITVGGVANRAAPIK